MPGRVPQAGIKAKRTPEVQGHETTHTKHPNRCRCSGCGGPVGRRHIYRDGGATSPSVTYYACLKAGKLTKVGAVVPTCKAPATQISWNSVGPEGSPGQYVYDWSGTAPAGSGGQSKDEASMDLANGSEINVLSATITGDFSSCPDGSTVGFGFTIADPPTFAASWGPSGSVTGKTPSTITGVTLGQSEPAFIYSSCADGSGNPPSYSFNIEFTVLPPPTTYS